MLQKSDIVVVLLLALPHPEVFGVRVLGGGIALLFLDGDGRPRVSSSAEGSAGVYRV